MTANNTVARPWEKAVEHSFILKVADNSSMTFAMPLDGDVEVAGDTIFGADACCTLIEFKRDIDAVTDEIDKFGSRKRTGNKKSDKSLALRSYAYAFKQLSKRDKYHYVVYGEWDMTAGTPVFDLKGNRYFSEKKIKGAVESIVSSKSGWSEIELAEYLKDFIQIKLYGDSTDGKGTGGQAAKIGINDVIKEEIGDGTDFDSTFIVAVTPTGRFMIPFSIVVPRLLKMVARLKLKI